MNQGIELDNAVILTVICTLVYLGAIAYRKWKDKGGRPGALTYWQDGEQHTVDVGFIKGAEAGSPKGKAKKARTKRG